MKHMDFFLFTTAVGGTANFVSLNYFETNCADFLKENSFAQSKCSDWKFCDETCVKNDKKYVKLEEKNFVQLWQKTWN